ncbi:MAG: nucleotidyltransferase domain-containing protein [Gammaproteobacteria bacterium]|nr:nucleotidyltransferase domain-containing protein [Gammaproteobacteria bacterium]
MATVVHASLTSQTLYAELLEQTLAFEASRSAASLPGTFTKRIVKGRTYHYYVYRDLASRYKQVYIGPDTGLVRKYIQKVRTEKRHVTADLRRIEELCSALSATGAMVTPFSHAKLIQALANGGLFRFGMVLVGTHAFTVLGNMLGVHWGEVHRTQDIDFAYDPDIDVGVADTEELDIPDVLQQLRMGFIPVPRLSHVQPSTSFRVRGKELRVDFLMPLTGRHREKPVYLPHLHTAVQPLRFLDYLIEKPEQGVIVANRGILVNVPNAGRYALHKLIVSQVRENQTKAKKDIHQAARICEVLLETRPGALAAASKALTARGKGWVSHFKAGLNQLTRTYPDIGKKVQKYLRH